jgi:hypothetical protein
VTVKITDTVPGYVSVADLPSSSERILIVGTGNFEPFEFAATEQWHMGAGPGLHQPQLYFYKPPSTVAAGRPIAKGWIVQMQRENGDPTADDSIYWPSDWPFSYLPYLGPPAIDYVQPGGTRGFRLKLPKGSCIHLGTHILKAISVADLIGGRIPFRS